MPAPEIDDPNDLETRQEFGGDFDDPRELDEIFSDDPERRRRRIASRRKRDFDPDGVE